MKECEYSKQLKQIQIALEIDEKLNKITEPLLLYALQHVLNDKINKLKEVEKW